MKGLLAFLLLGCAAASDRVSLEPTVTFHTSTSQWRQGARASADDTMTVHVMMRHEEADVKELHDVLMAVSDPRHDFYGKHLNKEQIAALAPISADKMTAAKVFLKDAVSLDFNAPHNDILTAKLFVQDVERLFQTTVHHFHHKQRDGVSLLRATAEYTVPSHIHASVAIIGDLVALPRLPTLQNRTVAVGGAGTWPNACSLSGCKGLITPAVLKQRYSVPDDSTGMEAPKNAMAVAEFQGQYFKKTDMQAFSKACKVNVSVDTVVGGDSQSAGVEAELDIEFIKGVSDGIPLTVIYSAQFSLLNWMTQVSKMTNPPQVHSVSYGNDEKQQTSTAYMFQCNVQFMKAGAQGISVLFASGDQGVCGREGCGFFKKRFKPDFPAGSPYITGVGGTDFVTDSIGDETAWSASGGGFSDTFGIPAWQADAVKAYKANPDAKLPAQSMWNNTGRGYPDISALGGQKTPYCVVVNGGAEGVAGTSASSPTATSVFARVNGVRLKAGKPVLGFLNPFIYQNSAAFNDVTSGCNTGGGSGSNCFTATKGWDPATGWGTPNFKALSAAAMAMFE